MTATVMLPPIMQFSDQDGLPLVGGKLYTYLAGTSTPLAVYTDVELTPGFEYPNPIILDAAGTPGGPVYMQPYSYKFVLTDEDDVQIFSADNIATAASV